MKQEFKDILNDKELNQIPYYLSKMDSAIYHLIQQGATQKNNRLRKLKKGRNYIRLLLLKKLLEWYCKYRTNEKMAPETSFSEIQEEMELKKQIGGLSSKEIFKELLKGEQ